MESTGEVKLLTINLKRISNLQYLILVELTKAVIRQNTNRTRISKRTFLRVLLKLYKEIYQKEEKQTNNRENTAPMNEAQEPIDKVVQDSPSKNDEVLEQSSNEVSSLSTLELETDVEEYKTIALEEISNEISDKNDAIENICHMAEVEQEIGTSISKNICRFYRGVNITVTLSAGRSVTGELFECGEYYIVIKNSEGLHYINEDKIVCFA